MENEFSQNLLQLIKKRRSIRIFEKKKIPKEEILSLIEAAIWAPTACNNQELRFLIIDKEEEINEILKFKSGFKNVSAIILIFCDMSLPESPKYYHPKSGKFLPYIDAGLAIANIILYAQSKGIDSCVINLSESHFKKVEKNFIGKLIRKIKEVLGLYSLMDDSFEFYLKKHLLIPKHLKILGGVILGYRKFTPDLLTAMHGGKKIMRKSIDYYLVKKI